MAKKIDEETLKGLISAEVASSIAYDKTELSAKRAKALEYYQGEVSDLPPMPGRSSVTSHDLSDVIGWMLPGIMRVYTASDRMGICEPTTRGDEAFAEQATDYCNHIFWKDNDGYRILYDGTHDSLLHGDGIGKIWWDDTEECEISEHSGLSEEQALYLIEPDNVVVLASTEVETEDVMEMPDPMTGQLMVVPVTTWDLKIKRIINQGRIRIDIMAPEDLLRSKDAKSIDEARFLGHVEATTRSKLIKMGFKRSKVEALPIDGSRDWSEEQNARDDDAVTLDQTTDESQELIDLIECYIKVDVDGDGESETVKVYYAGNKSGGEILEWEVCDSEHPFFAVPCTPLPHRMESQSIYDETEDIMRVKTALKRQTLDGLYAHNLPQPIYEEGAIKNPDAVNNPQFGQGIILKKGARPIDWNVIPFVGDNSLRAMEFFDQEIEKRTGVSRSTMALDPEALQNQTATANQNAKDASYSKIELVARNQAEFGWSVMFKKMLRLLVKNQDKARTIRLRDNWVDMDPRHWNADMDVTVNVGLGTGSRDRDMAMLNTVLNNQINLADRLGPVAPEKALELLPMAIDTMKKIAESAGIRSADQFYPEIEEEDLTRMRKGIEDQRNQPSEEDKKLALLKETEKAKMQAQTVKEAAQMKADLRVEEQRMLSDRLKESQKSKNDLAIAELNNASRERIAFAQLGVRKDNETGQVISREDERNGAFLDALAQVTDMIGQLQATANLPKRIVENENGDPIGIEPILPETMN